MVNNYWVKMPYYHVRIKQTKRPHEVYFFDWSRQQLKDFLIRARKRDTIYFPNVWIDPPLIKDIEIAETNKKFEHYCIGYMKGENIFAEGRKVTSQLVKKPVRREMTYLTPSKSKRFIKNVFIVHGRDHKPMKELKAMLSEFGLNPMVLHEQPSGSRTIVEKLEKYSDVGYAFMILTPDDVGIST